MKERIILHIVLVVVMLSLSCSSRTSTVEIPVDISGLGEAGEIITDYEQSLQAPFSSNIFPKLDDCLYALDKSQVVQENLEPEDISKLRDFLFQRVVSFLEQEFQEGFCNNQHDYFAKLRAAVDTLQTKYQEIPQEQKQALTTLADWYQRHQNACTAGIAYPSKQAASPSDKYNVEQAERVIQAIKDRQRAYSHSNRCNEIKNYPSQVEATLSAGHWSFVSSLVKLYEQHDTRDRGIEESILSEINRLPKERKRQELLEMLGAIASNKAQTVVDSAYHQ